MLCATKKEKGESPNFVPRCSQHKRYSRGKRVGKNTEKGYGQNRTSHPFQSALTKASKTPNNKGIGPVIEDESAPRLKGKKVGKATEAWRRGKI